MLFLLQFSGVFFHGHRRNWVNLLIISRILRSILFSGLFFHGRRRNWVNLLIFSRILRSILVLIGGEGEENGNENWEIRGVIISFGIEGHQHDQRTFFLSSRVSGRVSGKACIHYILLWL
ncbi:uncharacterized protein LOC107021845 [Solanum pennellii]|uniref:Uncharacterized protein LOC107021845 n=1 Tax=Solanum pennellii TaxID=28526 RepID=A0ABM1VCB7_SOLPN|nr:uncharacterized protein LOC107021845 [Solanum pennellii]